jgi:hypothetical protein
LNKGDERVDPELLFPDYLMGQVSIRELINFTLLAAILGLLSVLGKSRPERFKGGIAFAAPMLAAAVWIWPISPMLHMKG